MKEKIILPIKYPKITSYSGLANLFSIISTNYHANHWIYDNFINLWCEDYSPDYLCQLRFESVYIRYVCPVIETRAIRANYLQQLNLNVIDAIKSALQIGSYVMCNYDRFYISYCNNYNKVHREHQCLIYGFDGEKEVFYFADFLNHDKYEFVEVEYNVFEKAFTNYQIELIIYKNYYTTYDRSLLLNNIDDFLNSTRTNHSCGKTLSGPEKSLASSGKMIYGLSCYDFVIDCLVQCNI